jgi:hypothetical protein
MRAWPTLAIALAPALASVAPATASALLATTPACEVFTAGDVSALLDTPAIKKGGTVTPIDLSDCYWDTDTDARLIVQLVGPEMFKPSGRSAITQFNDDVKLIEDSVKLEVIGDLGERAAIYPSNDAPNVWFVMMVVNGNYLQMTVTAAPRERIVTAMETAARRL